MSLWVLVVAGVVVVVVVAFWLGFGLWLGVENMEVELGSDQTSLHNPWAGGYYPAGLSFEESKQMMAAEPNKFRQKVQESLRRHVTAINRLTAMGMYFFDYGNAFLLESSRAGADIMLLLS